MKKYEADFTKGTVKRSVLENHLSRNYFLLEQSKQQENRENQLVQETRIELLNELLGYGRKV